MIVQFVCYRFQLHRRNCLLILLWYNNLQWLLSWTDGDVFRLEQGDTIVHSVGHHTTTRLNHRYIKRMELGNADAYFTMGTSYMYGRDGTPQDINYALELLLRAAELGSVESHK